MAEKFYVTTPIYYVNDEPHIGHAYTTILADVLARYHRLHGDETFFLTGVDEHGQKVQEAAAKRGLDPQAHCDELEVRFRDLWKHLEVTNDFFIRTTAPFHKSVVHQVLSDLHARGEIYDAEYEGLYCVPDERFWTEKDLVDGNCPMCGREVVPLSEKNYFFRMSKYQDWLIEHIQANPQFIRPETRRNEVLGFLRKPLGDLCISRPKSRLEWGIELPFDQDYVTYVWFDALLNYYSGVLDQKRKGDGPWWPATLHLIGKDILTTHSVYWPTMLKAAGLPLPESILAHGWWLQGEAKMSKSVGNVVRPLDLLDRYGVDCFRYFLMRDMVLGQDSTFSEDALIGRINSDLANDLGNCLNRVERMIQNYCDGRIPAPGPLVKEDEEFVAQASELIEKAQESMSDLRPHQAIEDAIQISRGANRYLEIKSPWKAVKTGGAESVATTLWIAAEAMRASATLLYPVMPSKSGEMLYRLGMIDSAESLLADTLPTEWLRWGILAPKTEIRAGGPLFPRIEVETEA